MLRFLGRILGLEKKEPEVVPANTSAFMRLQRTATRSAVDFDVKTGKIKLRRPRS